MLVVAAAHLKALQSQTGSLLDVIVGVLQALRVEDDGLQQNGEEPSGDHAES